MDFRADGPGTVNPVAGALRLVDRRRRSSDFEWRCCGGDLAGDVYTGKAGSVTVFTLTINDNGTYVSAFSCPAGSCGCEQS